MITMAKKTLLNNKGENAHPYLMTSSTSSHSEQWPSRNRARAVIAVVIMSDDRVRRSSTLSLVKNKDIARRDSRSGPFARPPPAVLGV